MESVSADRRWIIHVLLAMVVVASCCSAGVAGIVYLERDPPLPPPRGLFWAPDLAAAAAPFRPHFGACEIVDRRDHTVTTCEPGPAAPGKIVFTRYSLASNTGTGDGGSSADVSGPRNGGRISASDHGITWVDETRRLWIWVGAGRDWHVGRVLRWWDETTAGAPLIRSGGGSSGSPGASGPAAASPAAASPAPVGPPGAGAPPAVAEMYYLLQLFTRPWWPELKRCAAATEYKLIPPLPLIDRLAEIYAVCTLVDGWQRAGGFGEIVFVAWDGMVTQGVVHKMLADAFGAEQLRDLPGDSGPRSGRFLLNQIRSLNTCFLYWDDAAMAVGAIVFLTCPNGGRPTAASVQAFWDARR